MAAQSSSELKSRVATGLLGAAVLVALVSWGGWIGICFLTLVLSLGMAYEISTMVYVHSDRREKRAIFLMMAFLIHLIHGIFPSSEYGLLIGSFMALFSYFLFTAHRYPGEALYGHLKELMHSIFALIYVVFIPLYLTVIHTGPSGVRWTLLFLLIVWTGDTLAYFCGKRFGRTKLYSFISPKKTVEGGLGGLISGIGIAILFKLLVFPELPWFAAWVIPLLVGVVAQVGDFCESFLKRAYNKKDSGSILPGHGGFLDRFDGVVFSLPVMYACIKVLGGF